MKTYLFEVKVTGWVTREVEANNFEEARDLAAEIDMNMTIGDLQWKHVDVEDTEE